MSAKHLVIVRHAHRDKSQGREADNGISDKGKKQAERVRDFLQKKYSKCPLVSSPKLRCKQTLEPLAKAWGTKVQVDERLDEQGRSEEEFIENMESFFKWWKKEGPEVMMVCSHGDWIPSFIDMSSGAWVELRKGGVAVISMKDKDDVRLDFVDQEPGASS